MLEGVVGMAALVLEVVEGRVVCSGGAGTTEREVELEKAAEAARRGWLLQHVKQRGGASTLVIRALLRWIDLPT